MAENLFPEATPLTFLETNRGPGCGSTSPSSHKSRTHESKALAATSCARRGSRGEGLERICEIGRIGTVELGWISRGVCLRAMLSGSAGVARGGGGFSEFSRFEPAEASAMGRMMCVRACCRAAERAGSLAAQAGGRRVCSPLRAEIFARQGKVVSGGPHGAIGAP